MKEEEYKDLIKRLQSLEKILGVRWEVGEHWEHDFIGKKIKGRFEELYEFLNIKRNYYPEKYKLEKE